MKTEEENFKIPNAHRGEMFWPIAVVVVSAGVGLAWWCFPYLTKIKSTSTPALQLSAQTEPDYYGARLNSIEEKLSAWAKDKAGIVDRMTQLEKSMSAGVRRA